MKDLKAIRKRIADYKELGFKVNLIKFYTSKQYRNFLFRKKIEGLGYYSSDKTPEELFKEVLIDKIYNIKGLY